MDTLETLLTRTSSPRLCDPPPRGSARERIFRAALRAPDHARLRPWRFLVVEGDGRARLGEAMVRATLAARPDADAQSLDKLAAAPLRAPLVLVLVARTVEHPKVPVIEQQLSLACAAHAMLLAAHALGFGGIWRTGDVTYLDALRAELGLLPTDRVAGFLYLGTPEVAPREPMVADPADFFLDWPPTGG
ncbi:MAG: putative NAD(P)H nitroreductase YdjA [Pseudomonadales bacterium]|nr:putative NAD(P)H nitroreductase YdjA [Pseudomonadales bacterium]